jgi:pimeloyl-ACP methyl ester carboxylesterase
MPAEELATALVGSEETPHVGGLTQRRAGAGSPMLLLHGIGGSWRNFQTILPLLARSYDVLGVDMPGYGASPPLPAEIEPSVPALADAVARELDRLGIDKAHILGNALGGFVALELARQGRALTVVALAPAGLSSRIVLTYTVALLTWCRFLARTCAPVADQVAGSRLMRWLTWRAFLRYPGRPPAEAIAHGIRDYGRSPSFFRTLRWLNRNQAVGLEEIECPVHIVWGTQDFVIPKRNAVRFEPVIQKLSSVQFRKMGHASMLDDPELILREVLAVAEPG